MNDKKKIRDLIFKGVIAICVVLILPAVYFLFFDETGANRMLAIACFGVSVIFGSICIGKLRNTTFCPACQEEIAKAATKCKHCQSQVAKVGGAG